MPSSNLVSQAMAHHTTRDIWSFDHPYDEALLASSRVLEERISAARVVPPRRSSSTALRRIRTRCDLALQPSLPNLLAARRMGRGTRLLSIWQRAVNLTSSTLTSYFEVIPLFTPSTTRPSGRQPELEYLSLTLSFGDGSPIYSCASDHHHILGTSSSAMIRSEIRARLLSAAGSLLTQIGPIAARFYTRAVVWIWPFSSSRSSFIYWIAPVQVETSFPGRP